MDNISKKFFDAVKDEISALEWEEKFPELFFCDRTGSRGTKSRRWKNLLSGNSFTTVADLRMEEIKAIKEYLDWDYTKLIFEYKLGWNTLSLEDARQLTYREGIEVSFDESIAA